MPLTVPIPVGQLMVQAQQKAAISREQLLEDVAALDRYNKDVNDLNDRATRSALEPPCSRRTGRSERTGSSGGPSWSRSRLAPFRGGASQISARRSRSQAAGRRAMVAGFRRRRRCGRLAGLQPVESLRTGDQVLAQDVGTGEVSYQAVARDSSGPAPADQEAHDWQHVDRNHGHRAVLGGRQGLGDGR